MELTGRVMFKGCIRSHFDLSVSEYMELPIRLRNKMLEQLRSWRASENHGGRSEAK